ncbi:hypothetical protein [uncultured Croceitalea sp.]|uniref:hypothetical protein n=1 Tax=uncultured Croceitalea sp. TaxID=1798908 RepID=UPI003305AEF9
MNRTTMRLKIILLILLFFDIQNSHCQVPGHINKRLLSYIAANEGVKTEPYLDTENHWTIGVGILLKLNLETIRKKYENDPELLAKAVKAAKEFNFERKKYLGLFGYDVDKGIAEGQTLDYPTILNLQFSQIEQAASDAQDFSGIGWNQMNNERKTVIIDMAYNLGLPKLNGFKKLKNIIRNSNSNSKWTKASNEIKNSRYFRQVKSRGPINFENFKSGNLDYKPRLPLKSYDNQIKDADLNALKGYTNFVIDFLNETIITIEKEIKREEERQRQEAENQANQDLARERAREAQARATAERLAWNDNRRIFNDRIRGDFGGGGSGGQNITGRIIIRKSLLLENDIGENLKADMNPRDVLINYNKSFKVDETVTEPDQINKAFLSKFMDYINSILNIYRFEY